MAHTSDPEVFELVTQTRQVIGRATRLSQDLQDMIARLTAFEERLAPLAQPREDQRDDR